MRQQNISPCRECICIAMCRHKRFTNLRHDCDIIFKFLYNKATSEGGLLYNSKRLSYNAKANFYKLVQHVYVDLEPAPDVWNWLEHYPGIKLSLKWKIQKKRKNECRNLTPL